VLATFDLLSLYAYSSIFLIYQGALTTVNKMGILSDFSNLWKALSGGAHIENK
jgi:hypothetical protein